MHIASIASTVPPGFREVRGEAFMETVGPIHARDAGDGTWDIGCRAGPQHANRFGGVHGGMLATLVDYALGFNLLGEGHEEAPAILLSTVSLNIDFVSGARMGEWLVVSTRIDKAQGRIRFCHCEMRADAGRLVLRASGVLSAAPLKSAA
ncbi:PaaI family thioesterase [Pantoea sp. 18069]|uniref:PaaI family thioesterase n=1 Tax=Pantoea sp. 18069 TaxID=2681415 RepID=UPI001358E424|nr:PaaI family thioesterase [Pantoea sp. 18069]